MAKPTKVDMVNMRANAKKVCEFQEVDYEEWLFNQHSQLVLSNMEGILGQAIELKKKPKTPHINQNQSTN
ncbi:hypothetical protein [Carnobacterium maltaromaticum]|uniref:hypothetical protein n=1 Tax=Carnobacterium maltaromaticum TaxID=2751 RepID=UPI0012FC9267|nr:hypothetical protein [Carnobacterium maltaromaticum]